MNDHGLMPFVEGRHPAQDVLGGGDQSKDEPVGVGFGIHFVKINASCTCFRLKGERPLLDINASAIAVDHGGRLVKRHRLDGHGRGHAQFKALGAHDGVV